VAPPSLRVGIALVRVARDGSAPRDLVVTPRIASEDDWKLLFAPERPCHIYAFLVDGAGTAAALLPGLGGAGSASLREREAPAGKWFYADATVGTDVVHIVVTPEADPTFERLALALKDGAPLPAELDAALRALPVVDRGAVVGTRELLSEGEPIAATVHGFAAAPPWRVELRVEHGSR
jgi:hypothetical protein